jgi:cell division protein FtsB
MKKRLTIHRIWAAFFISWSIALTGIFSHKLATPGAMQAIRLDQLGTAKRVESERLEAEIARLGEEIGRLKSNSFVQESEIRKTLGYAAPDELIFDFTYHDESARN